ncbi:MAG: hypothetical protein JWP61_1547, partial [Friedmanniella sp.]|nr:hypothetical protein [Friedmanniella sp.]
MQGSARRGLLVDAFVGALLGLAVVAAAVTSADGPPWAGRGGPHGHAGGGPGPAEVLAVSPWLVVAAGLVALAVGARRLRPRPAFVVAVLGAGLGLAYGGGFGPVLLAPAL